MLRGGIEPRRDLGIKNGRIYTPSCLTALSIDKPPSVPSHYGIDKWSVHDSMEISQRWLGIACLVLIQERKMAPTPELLPGKFNGQRSLVGCSQWGRQESDTTERLHFDFSLSCIGEGNDNPLQCSCLENPRDGGA